MNKKNNTPISHEYSWYLLMLEIYRCPCSTVEQCNEWAERQTDNAPLTYASISGMSNIIYQGQLSGPGLTWTNPYHTHKYTNPYAYTQRMGQDGNDNIQHLFMFKYKFQLTSNYSEKLYFCCQGFHFCFDLDFKCAESEHRCPVGCLGQGLSHNDPTFVREATFKFQATFNYKLVLNFFKLLTLKKLKVLQIQ